MVALGLTATVQAQAGDPIASLPASPKDLLLALGSDAAAISEIAGAEQSSEAWNVQLSGMGTAMTEDQLAILADYLALNMPAELNGTDVAEIVAGFAPDGRELFVANCFACHGVASYYLLQDRDAEGWMEIFNAPYHRRLLTGENERETFASYAARAMPIATDAIPEAWKE